MSVFVYISPFSIEVPDGKLKKKIESKFKKGIAISLKSPFGFLSDYIKFRFPEISTIESGQKIPKWAIPDSKL